MVLVPGPQVRYTMYPTYKSRCPPPSGFLHAPEPSSLSLAFVGARRRMDYLQPAARVTRGARGGARGEAHACLRPPPMPIRPSRRKKVAGVPWRFKRSPRQRRASAAAGRRGRSRDGKHCQPARQTDAQRMAALARATPAASARARSRSRKQGTRRAGADGIELNGTLAEQNTDATILWPAGFAHTDSDRWAFSPSFQRKEKTWVGGASVCCVLRRGIGRCRRVLLNIDCLNL